MFVVNAGWRESRREGEKFLSSLARQRNIAQLLSPTITKILSFSFLFYIGTLFKKKKKKERKGLKTCLKDVKGMNAFPFL